MSKALPLSVYIEADADKIVQWSREKEELIHDLALEGTNSMIINKKLNHITLVKFFSSIEESRSYADISMTRDDIPESLEIAKNYYVENEKYEKAAIVMNLYKKLNII